MTMRGIDSSREIDPQRLLRDTRPLGEKAASFLRKPSNSALLMVGILVSFFCYPFPALFLFLI